MEPTLELVLRLCVAGLLGAAVGLEREIRGRDPGIRTLALVAPGASAVQGGGHQPERGSRSPGGPGRGRHRVHRRRGELANHRSSHMYIQGLHRLQLTWDRLVYPVGPPETRIEVEARTESEARFLGRVDAELRELFGSRLVPATQGKSRELCARLYPDLLDAA